MNGRRKLIYGLASCIAMLVIILDSKSTVSGIADGIDLCLQSVIPALFPFFVLSAIINSCFLGQEFSFMKPIRRFCRIPTGSESILLFGLFSGYPVGAQMVADAYHAGSLSKENAGRMLGFCSNAGPAFLFGMLATTFSRPGILWFLWGTHIISALIVGWLLPGGTPEKCTIYKKETLTVTKALRGAIKKIATVCGWVILFRMMLCFFEKWFLWLLPTELRVLISGFMELSNGCLLLQQVQNEGARLILASAMLAFGGICVAMQTVSVAGALGIGYYFPGKLLQMLISITICCIFQPLLLQNADLLYVPGGYLVLLMIVTALSAYLLRRKKVVAFGGRMLYNTDKKCV